MSLFNTMAGLSLKGMMEDIFLPGGSSTLLVLLIVNPPESLYAHAQVFIYSAIFHIFILPYSCHRSSHQSQETESLTSMRIRERAKRNKTTTFLGDSLQQWHELTAQMGLSTHASVGTFILDR